VKCSTTVAQILRVVRRHQELHYGLEAWHITTEQNLYLACWLSRDEHTLTTDRSRLENANLGAQCCNQRIFIGLVIVVVTTVSAVVVIVVVIIVVGLVGLVLFRAFFVRARMLAVVIATIATCISDIDVNLTVISDNNNRVLLVGCSKRC
jgi:hypothetical protein